MWQAKVLNCSLHNVCASLLERRSAPLIFGKCDNSNELRSIMKRKKKASSTRSAIKAQLLHSHHVHGCFIFLLFFSCLHFTTWFYYLCCFCAVLNFKMSTFTPRTTAKNFLKQKHEKNTHWISGHKSRHFLCRLLCLAFNYFFQTVYLSISCKLKLLCILRDFFPSILFTRLPILAIIGKIT